MTALGTMTDVDVTSREFKANPYPFYAWMREEAPVHPVRLPTKQRIWLIARYDDVNAMLKDERFLKNRNNAMSNSQLAKQPWVPGFLKVVEQNMLTLDDPDHA